MEKKLVKLNLGDVYKASTINECCQMVFGCNGMLGTSYFRPQTLRKAYKDRYYVWFENLNDAIHDYGTGRVWHNKIDKEGRIIIHSYLGDRSLLVQERDLDYRKEDIIVFNRANGWFSFVGVFNEYDAIIDEKRQIITYQKIADKIILDLTPKEKTISQKRKAQIEEIKFLLANSFDNKKNK
jgi:hypothetical protein